MAFALSTIAKMLRPIGCQPYIVVALKIYLGAVSVVEL